MPSWRREGGSHGVPSPGCVESAGVDSGGNADCSPCPQTGFVSQNSVFIIKPNVQYQLGVFTEGIYILRMLSECP